jgi:uncharacterized RDD family membrane protein YckC
VDEQNPYASPRAAVEALESAVEFRLGGRGERLGAALIDALIVISVSFPVMYFLGLWQQALSAALTGQRPGAAVMLASAAIGVGAYLAIQGYPLATAGQTWGKRLLKLRIVNLEGRKPSFSRLVLLRYGVTRAIAMVPVLGGLYALVDDLFIFRDDRRCIHDLIAGTRVVVAD